MAGISQQRVAEIIISRTPAPDNDQMKRVLEALAQGVGAAIEENNRALLASIRR
jgi:hypothetical protein